MITIIVAITADKGAIGRNGDMIYYVSADLKHFKALTTGHTVVMGRRTFESLPKGALPNRRNIVVTRNAGYVAPGAETALSLADALAMADGEEVFIIGGASIYEQAMPLADRLCVTLIEAPTPPDADTFFPAIDPDRWQLSEMGESAIDPKSGLKFRFTEFRPKGWRSDAPENFGSDENLA